MSLHGFIEGSKCPASRRSRNRRHTLTETAPSSNLVYITKIYVLSTAARTLPADMPLEDMP